MSTLQPHAQIHSTVNVEVSLNRAAKPGRIAFKLDGSILRSYRLGRLSMTPRWVQKVADDTLAGAP